MTCPAKGGPIQFPGFNGVFAIFSCFHLLNLMTSHMLLDRDIDYVDAGELMCPPYKELCGEVELAMPGQCLNGCNSNGECVDGTCKCLYGFSGKDCSIRN
jgi:hypothetical protein